MPAPAGPFKHRAAADRLLPNHVSRPWRRVDWIQKRYARTLIAAREERNFASIKQSDHHQIDPPDPTPLGRRLAGLDRWEGSGIATGR